MSEQHPYITDYFDAAKSWKYLIIGTFPPKFGCPQRKDLFRFFYGNEGSLWQILKETGLYATYDFNTIEEIINWQNAYSIGITDVLKQCSRKAGKECSPSDASLVVDLKTDLNTELKDYVLNNNDKIEKIYFTSGSETEGSNSAYWLFTKLMGSDFRRIQKNKLIKLPSPSGEFLRTVFSKAKTNFGLKQYFFDYLQNKYPEAISIAKETFEEKIKKPKTRINRKGNAVANTVKRFPNSVNYPSLYRLDLYRELMPKNKTS
jgi:hypothetical protein